MLKRALFFSTPFCLSLKDNQMIVHTKEAPGQQKRIPIEDSASWCSNTSRPPLPCRC